MRLKAALTGVNLQAFQETLPQTALSGELALVSKDDLLVGTVRLSNALGGPYDEGRLPLGYRRGIVA